MFSPGALRDNPFFRNLSDDQIASILAISTERAFDGGDVIVRQFDKNTDLVIVKDGKLMVRTFSGDVVAELGPGAVIGEVSLVDESPRSATVVSGGPSMVAIIPAAHLRDLVAADIGLRAQLFENVARILCARLRAANVQLDAARS